MLQAPLGKNKPALGTLPKGSNMPIYQMYQELLRKIGRYPAYSAQGTFSIALQPSNGEQFTIGTKVYTLQTVLTNVDGNIAIGGTVAITRQNIIDAINLTSTTGGPAVQYAQAMSENPSVSIAPFSGNNAIMTAKTAGTSGNSIATTETMAGAGNQFDAVTLGTTRAGADESDADSILFTADYSNVSAVADNVDAKWKNLTDYTQQGHAGWLNSHFAYSGESLAVSASRKVLAPNHQNRRYVSLRTVAPTLFTQRNSRAVIASPFAAGTISMYANLALDTTRVAYLYAQNSGTAGVYLVIAQTDANGVLTFGVPVLVDTTQTLANYSMALINTDKILIVYANTAASAFATARTASISVTGITMNAGVQIAATALTASSVTKVNTDVALIAWQNGTQVSYTVATSAGTAPSYGTAVNIASSPDMTKIIQNGTNKAQAFYRKASSAWTVAITVSGTVPTIGTELNFMLGNPLSQREYFDAVQVATDKFVCVTSVFDEANNGDRRNTFFLTVSSVTTTVASSSSSGINTGEWIRLLTVTAGSDYYFIWGNSNTMKGKKIAVDTTANTATYSFGNPDWEDVVLGNNYNDSGFWFHPFGSDMYNFAAGANVQYTQLGTKTIMAYVYNSRIHYSSCDRITLDVYVGESLVKSLTFNYAFLQEPKNIDATINDYFAQIRIKNTFSSPVILFNKTTWFEME